MGITGSKQQEAWLSIRVNSYLCCAGLSPGRAPARHMPGPYVRSPSVLTTAHDRPLHPQLLGRGCPPLRDV